jgi:hypothetical protein
MTAQKDYLATLRARIARVKRGEVWGSDRLGPYTAAEKTAEISRLESLIALLEAAQPK